MIRISANSDVERERGALDGSVHSSVLFLRERWVPPSPGQVWVIGSSPKCDIVVHRRTVSRRHCQLEFTAEGYRLQDLGSANGTFVNGELLARDASRLVTRKDRINLARDVFMPWPSEMELSNGDRVVAIGRASENEIVLNFPMVSSRHARLILRDDVAVIEDLASLNHVYLNGFDRPVKQALVGLEDVIYLGSHQVEAKELFRLADFKGDGTGSSLKTPIEENGRSQSALAAPQPLKEQSPAPSINLETQRLGEQLIACRIVAAEEWAQAFQADPSAPKEAVLRRLMRHNAAWNSALTGCWTSLTEYQFHEILAGRLSDLVVGRFVLLEHKGGGGMAQVYMARDTIEDRIVALKMMTEDDETSAKRFEIEGTILSKLDHPGITRLHHFDARGHRPYIAMEYIRGKDLKTMIQEAADEHEPAPLDWAVDVIVQVAEAIDYAHSKNVIHRDIKPNNIMISDAGEVKLLDLGIARMFDPEDSHLDYSEQRITQAGQSIGTPYFISPEQLTSARDAREATDIYSLGCTLYYVLCGKAPYDGDLITVIMAHQYSPVPRITDVRPEAPAALDRVLKRMMAKKPQDRYATAGEAAEALRQALTKKSGLGVFRSVADIIRRVFTPRARTA